MAVMSGGVVPCDLKRFFWFSGLIFKCSSVVLSTLLAAP